MSELRLKVATVWRGEWNANVAYKVLDEVSFSADIEGVKRGNYRSLIAANREPLSNENAWALVLDLEKTQSATKKAEENNKIFNDAETIRVENENKRIATESKRASEESKRASEESKRIENEYKRLSSENNRNDAETNRRIAEETRISNEQARQSTENSRVEAERGRTNAESKRASNEQARVTAENARVTAETNRANEFSIAQIERNKAFNEAEAGRDAKIDAKVEDITRLQGEVAKKANIDGYYSSMAVGAAESLLGQNVTTQQFTFQPSGNTLDVQDGRAVVKSIKGNTVVANQILKEEVSGYGSNADIKIVKNKERNYTIQGQDLEETKSGVILQMLPVNIGDNLFLYYKSNAMICFYTEGFQYNGIIGSNTIILKVTKQIRYEHIIVRSLYKVTEYNIEDFGIINLTQMFGAGNEPTSVEEFERLYPNLPTEYNEGSLLNLNADSIKSVGFNLFDKNTVQRGAYIKVPTLEVTSYPELEESVSSFIRVIPNETYYIENAISNYHRSFLLFDKDKKAIDIMLFPHGSTIDGKHLAKGLITIPENVYYIRFGVYNEYLGSCVFNLSHSGYRDGEYEPYKESIVNLPIKKFFPDGMKSAGAIRDEIVWDESIKKYKAIQRVGSVDLGITPETNIKITLPYNTYQYGYIDIILPIRHIKNSKNSLLAKYPASNGFEKDKTHLLGENVCNLYVIDSSYTDVASFKQSLQGQILYYELETPIETIIDDYNGINYEVSDFGTEEIIADEPTTPIVVEVVYGVNAVDTLRRLPQNYISTDSMRDFLAQLGSAMNGDWAMTFDEVNNKWVFAFAANEVVNNEE